MSDTWPVILYIFPLISLSDIFNISRPTMILIIIDQCDVRYMTCYSIYFSFDLTEWYFQYQQTYHDSDNYRSVWRQIHDVSDKNNNISFKKNIFILLVKLIFLKLIIKLLKFIVVFSFSYKFSWRKAKWS